MKNKGFTPLEISKTTRKIKFLTGFTLVEILISLVILALGLVVLFNIFPLGLQSITYSRKLNEVSLVAQKKLEEIKSQGPIQMGKTSGKEGDFNWQLSTETLKLTGDVEVIYVELDIDFNFLGKTQKQRFVSYLAGD